jgi:peptidoglycan biosynthesis protein MviN/MurJ (putative lipid II flippase)
VADAFSALALTLVIEVPTVAFFYAGERKRLAIACAIATTATNLAMNTWLYHAVRSYDVYLLVGEIGAVLVEALVYWGASREHELGRAILASAVANAASFAVGWKVF